MSRPGRSASASASDYRLAPPGVSDSVVSLSRVKQALRIDDNSEDEFIQGLIEGAVARVSEATGIPASTRQGVAEYSNLNDGFEYVYPTHTDYRTLRIGTVSVDFRTHIETFSGLEIDYPYISEVRRVVLYPDDRELVFLPDTYTVDRYSKGRVVIWFNDTEQVIPRRSGLCAIAEFTSDLSSDPQAAALFRSAAQQIVVSGYEHRGEISSEAQNMNPALSRTINLLRTYRVAA